MNNNNYKPLPYEDMLLTCVQCDKPFDYPATEQDYFAKHNLAPPKRCRSCRDLKQKQKEKDSRSFSYPLSASYGGQSNRQNDSFRKPVTTPLKAPIQEIQASVVKPQGKKPSDKIIAHLKAENETLRDEMRAIMAEIREVRRLLESRNEKLA